MNFRGIDVSYHQGVISWEAVKPNIDFAILRCGYGGDLESYDDKQFIYNANECTRLNIPFGVYLYSYATNIEEAKSEVAHTLRLIQNYKLRYPVFYDVEDPTYQDGLSSDTLTDICTTYCNQMEAAGYYVGIYSSLNWFQTKLNSSTLARYDKWVAQWNAVDEATFTHGMWQYTSSGSVGGMTGNVDMNLAYYDYPTLIIQNGMNGFPKKDMEEIPEEMPNQSVPEKTPIEIPNTDTKDCETALAQLQEENEILKKEIDAGTNKEEELKLIFTCPKKATYYITLEENDQLYFKKHKKDIVKRQG